jgi:hypothetical protein
MEFAAAAPSQASAVRRVLARVESGELSAWTLAFSLVFYLAMRGGGYDAVVRGEVGVAVWWIVLLAGAAGYLPARLGRAGWIAVALMAGFAAWTGIAIGWSQNAEASVAEFGREVTYLGFLVLAICLQGRAAARATVNGLACALALVTGLAVLSRLHPSLFPANAELQFLGLSAGRRLGYPLNYWNGLAAVAAMGVPLLVGVEISARTVLGRALAAAALPLSSLCLYLTVSRGGVLELAIGVAVFLALVPRRLEAVATLVAAGAGSAAVILAASHRPAVRTGLTTPAAMHAGTQVLTLTLLACAGVAFLQAALGLGSEYLERPRVLRLSRAHTRRLALAGGLVAVVCALALGAPGTLEHEWSQFKQPPTAVHNFTAVNLFSRLSIVNGDGRYQLWQSALNANATSPWLGIGPGTFAFWWAAHATTSGAVLNAHSLYLETLAETGIIGLLLLGGLFVFVAVTAIHRSLREDERVRLPLAAAAGGLAAFLTAAAIDWVWQLSAIAAAALVLVAVITAGQGQPAGRTGEARVPRRRLHRIVPLATALAALVAISIPLAATVAVRRSQSAAAAGNLAAAYAYSRDAALLQPYAASPRLQEALILEQERRYGPAANAATAATRNGPTDWKTWVTLARIDAERGATAPALAALDRARALNPRSALFAEVNR